MRSRRRAPVMAAKRRKCHSESRPTDTNVVVPHCNGCNSNPKGFSPLSDHSFPSCSLNVPPMTSAATCRMVDMTRAKMRKMIEMWARGRIPTGHPSKLPTGRNSSASAKYCASKRRIGRRSRPRLICMDTAEQAIRVLDSWRGMRSRSSPVRQT